MPNFTDQELVQMSVGAQSMWLMSALTGGELINDLLEARKTIEQQKAEIDRVTDTLDAWQKRVAELNASNQQLAQTIKDMDAGYERNVERFKNIVAWGNDIVCFASAGTHEEGDNT